MGGGDGVDDAGGADGFVGGQGDLEDGVVGVGGVDGEVAAQVGGGEFGVFGVGGAGVGLVGGEDGGGLAAEGAGAGDGLVGVSSSALSVSRASRWVMPRVRARWSAVR